MIWSKYYHYCRGHLAVWHMSHVCRTDCPLLWHPCGQCPHYPAISDPAPAPAAIILRQTISNISHLAPLVSWQYSWHNVSHYSGSGPDTWPAPTPRLFVSPRTEKYRQRKWASESRGTCRQDTSHFRPLPSADKFSPLGAGRRHQGRPDPGSLGSIHGLNEYKSSKTWLNNLWPFYETFLSQTINPQANFKF